MEGMNLIKAEKIENLPLFFWKIYYQELSSEVDEEKLISYREDLQTIEMADPSPVIPISKTVNFTLFKYNDD